MRMFDDNTTAFNHLSAHARAPKCRHPSMTTAGFPQAGAKAGVVEPHAAATARLQVAKANCKLALDNIEMAKMVVTFLEHLLQVKLRKDMAVDELAATRASIASARGDVENARQGFRQACKAFHAAHQRVYPDPGSVPGQAGAAQTQSAPAA